MAAVNLVLEVVSGRCIPSDDTLGRHPEPSEWRSCAPLGRAREMPFSEERLLPAWQPIG